MLPERGHAGSGIEYANDIVYKKRTVNLLVYKEQRKRHGEENTTTFMWITSCRINDKNAGKLARAGRNRWKIENQGFNRQKHWQGNLEHACSWNAQVQKVQYLIEQIADLMKQLYEVFYLERFHIEKPQKNISSDLLASFGRHQTGEEDIKIGKMLNNTAFC